MHSYNIVLKTSDSVSGDVDEYGDTDTASMTYAFDWSFIPDGDYELSYTFKTERYEDSTFALPHAISLPPAIWTMAQAPAALHWLCQTCIR